MKLRFLILHSTQKKRVFTKKNIKNSWFYFHRKDFISVVIKMFEMNIMKPQHSR